MVLPLRGKPTNIPNSILFSFFSHPLSVSLPFPALPSSSFSFFFSFSPLPLSLLPLLSLSFPLSLFFSLVQTLIESRGFCFPSLVTKAFIRLCVIACLLYKLQLCNYGFAPLTARIASSCVKPILANKGENIISSLSTARLLETLTLTGGRKD